MRSLALSAFLASAANTLDLQSQILSASSCTTDIHFDSYLSVWQAAHGSLSSSDPLPDKQSLWDKAGILFSRAIVEASISDPHQMAIGQIIGCDCPSQRRLAFGSPSLLLWAEVG